VGAPVISVGNIQIGGTGKTPMVEYLAESILQNQRIPVIISRGYRRKTKEPVLIIPGEAKNYDADMIGDEPLLLLQNLRDAVLSVDSDRCRAAMEAINRWKDAILILDDGFQHRKIKRDLNIVMIDVSRWSALPLLFPMTNFRDVKSSLRLANCVILTHTKNLQEKTQDLKKWLVARHNLPVYTLNYEARLIINLNTKEKIQIKSLLPKKIACFCGIANPGQFYTMLQELKFQIGWQKSFQDHYKYKKSDLTHIVSEANKVDAQIIITTQKDAVKLEHFVPDQLSQLYYLKIDCKIEPFDHFSSQLQQVFLSWV
jgi:tetraacyldisaccharide 4'-kinase